MCALLFAHEKYYTCILNNKNNERTNERIIILFISHDLLFYHSQIIKGDFFWFVCLFEFCAKYNCVL